MKMKLGATWCYLLFMLINHKYSNLFASAKSLETHNILYCHESLSFLNVTIAPSENFGKCYDRCSMPFAVSYQR